MRNTKIRVKLHCSSKGTQRNTSGCSTGQQEEREHHAKQQGFRLVRHTWKTPPRSLICYRNGFRLLIPLEASRDVLWLPLTLTVTLLINRISSNELPRSFALETSPCPPPPFCSWLNVLQPLTQTRIAGLHNVTSAGSACLHQHQKNV